VKNLSDTVALSAKEHLKNTLITLLTNIKQKFPDKSERYIEIEI
jgi:hypothetical protein